MGSYDGAETCELVGLYLLYQLKDLGIDIGLHRDNGLSVSYLPARRNDQLRKQIEAIFKSNQLSITAKANIIEVNFLDITFNAREGTYEPYTKDNNHTKYVNIESNHPPEILKSLPAIINYRLSQIFSS